jgi:hypothetical protein
MDNRRNLITIHVEAETEAKLEAKLYQIGLEIDKLPNVLSIYPKGSKVVAWLQIEKRHVELKAEPIKKTKAKKKTKKKAVK